MGRSASAVVADGTMRITVESFTGSESPHLTFTVSSTAG
jgi:hypothetical protein